MKKNLIFLASACFLVFASCKQNQDSGTKADDSDQSASSAKEYGVVVKYRAFIAPINGNVGFPGILNTPAWAKAKAFAVVTDGGFSETYQSFPGRFTTQLGYKITCEGGKATKITQSIKEVIPGTEPADPGPFNFTASAKLSVNVFSVEPDGTASISLQTEAAPPAISEPVFQAIQGRNCKSIWNYASLHFSCSDKGLVLQDSKAQVSGFPSHYLQIGYAEDANKDTKFVEKNFKQGSFDQLWECRGAKDLIKESAEVKFKN